MTSYPLSKPDGLRALGSTTPTTTEHADETLLERFPNPHYSDHRGVSELEVEIIAPEFTSLCPKTGQPDFATIRVRYVPGLWCVESKSLKLYLNSFRNFGEFHEACVTRIGNALVDMLAPVRLEVIGEFTPRGGIKFWPRYAYVYTPRQ